MKNYDKILFTCIALIISLFVFVNIVTSTSSTNNDLHKVEISRIVTQIANTSEIPDEKNYSTIIGIYKQKDADKDFFTSKNDYVISEIDGDLYRIEYSKEIKNTNYMLYINIALTIFSFIILGILIYIRQSIIVPFNKISDLPYELSKGNLTIPLEENKQRYFGKFLWGLDMLREKLEDSKRAELELLKDKKTLLLSLSHDIKTPLAAIKLYAKALSKGIYTDKEKQLEVANSINLKADEIEKYVSEIIHSQSDNIISFEIKSKEFYLSEVIDNISSYYKEKLKYTNFNIADFSDCLLNGDPDRLIEVLQNILENAIKYGDGISISINFHDEEDCRIITIKNSGCTLEQNELSRIFDSFFRGSNIGSKSGNGLGLYICRQLTQAMGGDIYADIEDGYMCVSVVCKKR